VGPAAFRTVGEPGFAFLGHVNSGHLHRSEACPSALQLRGETHPLILEFSLADLGLPQLSIEVR